MHDPEKSDSGIVATKPTNKAGRPVAEPVERRVGTEGNARELYPANFDLQALKQKQEALQRAAESGTLTNEQTREMTAEQRAAVDKSMKERLAVLAKNKALSDSFNQGMTAFNAKQCDVAAQAFTKAAEVDPKQVVVWQQLAEAYTCLAGQKTGAEHDAALGKALEAYQKALELKPDDAASHNNYGLALVRAKKFKEALDELGKAAQLDPPGAGKYYYNLGAILVNIGQSVPAAEAFKKAIETDPNYADAYYQYGVSLVSKASYGADGKVTPVPGTVEALQKYLALAPTGQFAQPAKDMLTTLSASVDVSYKNPNAKEAPKKKK